VSTESLSPEERERTEAAAIWWLRLQKDESAVFSAEFRDWVALPENEREFQALELAAETLDKFGTSPSIAEMRRSARAWFHNEDASQSRSSWSSWSALTPAYAMAAAALLVAVAGGAYWFVSQPISYQTAVGERRTVALQDGSRILLDSNSEVDIRYSQTARAVTLAKGRARFDVAHDRARPFAVAAGTETVTAVGTSFDVELRGTKVLVTLVQGRILITDGSDRAIRREQASAPIELSAGQQLVISTDRKPVIAPADFAVTQAWQAGRLIFRGERLADAVEQINRYTDHPIAVDPSAASFPVSGVFNTGDTKSFVSAATDFYPIEAVSDANGAITLRRSP
jgi:transmembrane sensor